MMSRKNDIMQRDHCRHKRRISRTKPMIINGITSIKRVWGAQRNQSSTSFSLRVLLSGETPKKNNKKQRNKKKKEVGQETTAGTGVQYFCFFIHRVRLKLIESGWRVAHGPCVVVVCVVPIQLLHYGISCVAPFTSGTHAETIRLNCCETGYGRGGQKKGKRAKKKKFQYRQLSLSNHPEETDARGKKKPSTNQLHGCHWNRTGTGSHPWRLMPKEIGVGVGGAGQNKSEKKERE